MMIKNYFKIAVASALLFSLNVAAGPLDSTTVPKSAKWYFHVNMEKLSQGEMGKLMDDFDFLVLFKTGDRSGLQYFTKENGDLAGSLTGYGTSMKPCEGVLQATGIKAGANEEIVARLSELGDHQSTEEGDYTLHSWSQKVGNPEWEKTKQMHGVFLDESTFLVSQEADSLRAAIAHRDSGKAGVKVTNTKSAMLAKYDLSELETKSAIATMAKSIETELNVAKSGALEGTCSIQAATVEDAQKMVQSLEGMIAFSSLSGKFDGWDPVENVKVAQSGSKVNVDLSVPASALKMFSNR